MYSSECTSGFQGVPTRIWPHLLRLVTKAMSDMLTSQHYRFCCDRRCLTQSREARLAKKARLAGTGLTRHASLAPRACRASLCHYAADSADADRAV